MTINKPTLDVLYISSSVFDDIFYEEEEYVITKALKKNQQLNINLDIPAPVSSTLYTIKNRLNQYYYDIVIISCHGYKNNTLQFEDENGEEDRIDSDVLSFELSKIRYKPGLLILASCFSAYNKCDNIPLHQKLQQKLQIPFVLGVKKELHYRVIQTFFKLFIENLSVDKPIKPYLITIIKRVQQEAIAYENPAFTILNKSIDNNLTFYQLQHQIKQKSPINTYKLPLKLLIGRRKELRSILTMIYNNNQVNRICIIKGDSGIGKSSFIEYLMRYIDSPGKILINLSGHISILSILKILYLEAIKHKIKNSFTRFCFIKSVEKMKIEKKDFKTIWQKELLWLIDNFFSKYELVITLNQFETNITYTDTIYGEVFLALSDPELQLFFNILSRELTSTNHLVIIETQYSCPGLPGCQLDLQEFNKQESNKFISAIYHQSKMIHKPILHYDWDVFGGHPTIIKHSLSISEQKELYLKTKNHMKFDNLAEQIVKTQ